MPDKQDSNVTGLRYAEEITPPSSNVSTIGVLPATPRWNELEPNSYRDFGGNFTNVARQPIDPSRQLKKGVLTDLDAAGGFESDFTQTNLPDHLQGFFFADYRGKNDVGANRQPVRDGVTGEFDDYTITDIDGANQITIDSRVAVSAAVVAGGTGYAVDDIFEVTDANATVLARFRVATEAGGVVATVDLIDPATIVSNAVPREGRTHTDTGVGAATVIVTGSGDNALTVTVTYGNGLSWIVNDLIFMAGHNAGANNGLKHISAATDNQITTTETLTLDAAPAAGATITTVGHQGGAGDIDVDAAGGVYPALTTTTLNFTTLQLNVGEWIYIGGDAAAEQFANAANNGFAKIHSIAANRLELQQTQSTMVTESSTTENVHLYLGRVLKNEADPTLQVRRSYNLERTLGDDGNGTQSEYLKGAVSSIFEWVIPTADKLVSNVDYMAIDHETRDGTTGVKAGTRPALAESDAFNTSSDFSRLRMQIHSDVDSNPTTLFAYVTQLNLTVNNNLVINKAVSVLGGFDVTAGFFTVAGNATAYFSDVSAIAAIRNNSDVSLSAILAKSNTGIAMDIPLITLGEGRANVEINTPITLPLSLDAATAAKINANMDHTLMMTFFDYLPTAAE